MKSMNLVKPFLLGMLISFGIASPRCDAIELAGLLGYHLSMFSEKPSNYESASGGVGYAFLGRVDLGPGMLESGFLAAPNSITTRQTFGNVKASGFYWIIPLMYRINILPPFFSLAVGGDYAVESSTSFSVSGAQLSSTTNGYQNHFGAQVSLEAVQDVGENLSILFDARYRQGLGTAITINSQAIKYNFLMLGIGLQKRLE